MVIIFILLAQIILSAVYFAWQPSLAIVFVSAILFTSLFFTVAYLNNLMNQKEELKKSNAKNLKFKRNYDLFKRELLDRGKIEFADNDTFFLGSKDAKLHISVISNPYCGFCKDAHKILENLLAQYPEEVSAQIRFNYTAKRNDEKYTQLISNFQSIYRNKKKGEFMHAVEKWFDHRNEDEIKILAGNNNPENLTDISNMTVENSAAGLTFTPVFILNGCQFPDKYDREDIYYFISELIEDEDFPR